jgi:hypothetical protein
LLIQLIRAFVIDPKELLSMAVLSQPNQTLLADSRTIRSFDQTGNISAGIFEQAAKRPSIGIVSYNTQTYRHCPKDCQVGNHRAGTAAGVTALDNLQNDNGGFRAYAECITVDIAVQYEIANNTNSGSAQIGRSFQ